MGSTTYIPPVDMILIIIFSGISICLSIAVIIICIKKQILESFTSKIIICMSINDTICSLNLILIQTLAKFINNCWFLYLFDASIMSNLIWALCIALTLREVIIKKSAHYKRYFKFWFILAYPMIIVLFAIPFITGGYIYNGGVCYITEKGYWVILLYLLFTVPFLLFTFTILIIFINIYISCRGTKKNSLKTIIIKRGYIYPLSVLIIILPSTISACIEYFYKSSIYNKSGIFTLTFLSCHGILNAITLMLNKSVRKIMFKKPEDSMILRSLEGYSFLDITE
ncbi:hypothetical protein SteCoe_1106 [Stentor coeruleus]|uniref:G-protein coupled receptors family 2 profile 2 domain-containing protein n=1 Tax=Stentor coeruleus TaxID=5963 RepID=A0A1R2D2N8_9CILI|nr:hypothetical protein SteCoe_1106 [Stentor coeruleus]